MPKRCVLILLLAGVGCVNEKSGLEAAIQDFLTLRYEGFQGSCECFELYIDISEPGGEPFTSENECKSAYPPPTSAGSSCVEEVLRSGPYDTEGNIEFMECYVAALRENMDCFAQDVAPMCSGSALEGCTTQLMQAYGVCNSALTDDQVQTIILCGVE